MKPLLIIACLCAASFLVLLFVPQSALQNTALRLVERLVALSAPVDEILPEMLQQRMESGRENILIFDTRAAEEFHQSHLKGALHCPPDITPEEFTRRFGSTLRGKEAVWYCSVGKRSSDALLRLQNVCAQAGIQHSYNLRGGIFRWHNEGRPIVDESGSASSVHPFSATWGLLVR
ncbi:MAG: rhodanese-like domain-containing protein [Candidatus Kapabacteria bacterium]|jgi:rhodanese-related sulfurtransferase|nr:rhodanese-like domain-containing protein [Candidatus Kapabacteria bacterium]